MTTTPENPPAAVEDDSLNRYARMLHRALGTDMALVSVVRDGEAAFSGTYGLPEPWAAGSVAPVAGSMSWHVLHEARPILLADAAADARAADAPSVRDYGMHRYAGAPMIDSTGAVTGVVLAFDQQIREWRAEDEQALLDIAASCAAEVEQRERRAEAQRNEQQAVADGRIARALLSLSEQLAATTTLDEVAQVLHTIAVTELDALHAGLWIVGDGNATYVDNPARPWVQATNNAVLALDTGNPVGLAIVTERAAFWTAIDEHDAQFPGLAERRYTDDGEARAFVPLAAAGRVFGCLAAVWPDPRQLDDADRTILRALGAYTAQAVQRAQLLAERVDVAMTLQNAMLTRLPETPGLALAAGHRAAAEQDQVGGDWHDAVVRPDGSVVLTVGDVVGHDTAAAATMGQLRSMLRAFVWADAASPAQLLSRLDRAADDLRLDAFATAVVVTVSPGPGERTVTWSDAGHPVPLVLGADGRCRALGGPLGEEVDPMLGARPGVARRDRVATVAPGDTLLLFTDGLVELRPGGVDAGVTLLSALLEREHHLPLDRLVDTVIGTMLYVGPAADDAALLAARITR